MTIAEAKKALRTFQFFDKNYWNNILGKLIVAVRAGNLKRS